MSSDTSYHTDYLGLSRIERAARLSIETTTLALPRRPSARSIAEAVIVAFGVTGFLLGLSVIAGY